MAGQWVHALMVQMGKLRPREGKGLGPESQSEGLTKLGNS